MVDLGQKKVELSTFFYAQLSAKKMLPNLDSILYKIVSISFICAGHIFLSLHPNLSH